MCRLWFWDHLICCFESLFRCVSLIFFSRLNIPHRSVFPCNFIFYGSSFFFFWVTTINITIQPKNIYILKSTYSWNSHRTPTNRKTNYILLQSHYFECLHLSKCWSYSTYHVFALIIKSRLTLLDEKFRWI